MPSGSSAPSLPSPELYSLEHFLWYDGSTRTSPSPEEGKQQLWKMPDDCTDDDVSAGESFHTATSRPSSPQREASGSPDPARREAVPHPENLRNASVASPPQDPERRGAPSPLPERAPTRNQLSPLSAFNTLHHLGSTVGGDDSHGERSSIAQESAAQLKGVDRQLLRVAGETSVNPSPSSSLSLAYPDYSPNSHDAGDTLFDHADTTMD